jgi:oligoribonuclease
MLPDRRCREPRLSKLVWMDLEMTGLDPERDVIIEMATVVTGPDLEIIEEGPEFAIRQPRARLDAMDQWNRTHHGASGLIDRVLNEGIAEREAEAVTLAFLEKHVEPRTAPLCGNTIWQDRRFLARYMPTLEGYLHYRNVDVSSIKELARRWRPDLIHAKRNAHTALADILESIEELRFYRDRLFRLDPAG